MAKTIEMADINDFDEAMDEQGYSRETRAIVVPHAETIEPGEQDLPSGDIIYIAVMPDDSGSIAGKHALKRYNTQDVIDGHNSIVEALKESTAAHTMLFKTQFLKSETALNNWVKLKKVVPMTRDNFTPRGQTPLYDRTISLLSSLIYKRTEALKAGHSNVRWGILLITDGEERWIEKSSE